MTNQSIDQLVQKVLHYLSYRSRSRSEIETFLQGKQAAEEEIEVVLSKISDMGLVDDEDFCSQVINSKIKKGNGPKKIYFNLLNKGIPKDLANTSINNVDQDKWVESALGYVEKKLFNISKLDKNKQTQKIYDLLYSRGFDTKTIRSVIDALASQE